MRKKLIEKIKRMWSKLLFSAYKEGIVVPKNDWERMMLDQWSLNVKDEKRDNS